MHMGIRFFGVLAVLLSIARPARGDDFRIQTRVYFAGEPDPVSQNTTLFHQGQVYDFLETPAEITIYDPAAGTFTLLDPSRQQQTSVSIQQVQEFIATLRGAAESHDDAFLTFLGKPEFREETTQSGDALTLTSPFMTYRVELLQAKNSEVAQQYADFSDAYAQLNTMTNPASLPPFARMRVNAALERRQALPSNVQLLINTRKGPGQRKISYRSEHDVAWRLSSADEQRIAETEAQRQGYREVELAVYAQPTARQARSK